MNLIFATPFSVGSTGENGNAKLLEIFVLTRRLSARTDTSGKKVDFDDLVSLFLLSAYFNTDLMEQKRRYVEMQ